ncbi:Holliday junction branch migration DNA helicase RuvB [Lentisphaera marina]|uniref:Holliday junction branch migration DNA helicase RuvB n=1 Tax=Lentisphaera marina TaxID=1111041 RepID=UPI0023668078|nr:Holliday junction branch migration DNA helicase RuvB [Lentisphaera marina]MDD7986940.1 Holliday junction branch migration DNA helicase RuvB [Lentisphaera marina]
MSENFFESTLKKETGESENILRPKYFADFPGQDSVKERLSIFVEAAKMRDEALGHFILSGPPGLGKTTLAYIVANERGKGIKTSSGPVLEKPGDLAGLLTSLSDGDILFIDEIHRLPISIEEYLYSAMEDFFIDIMIDQGVGARSVRLNIPQFTLVGATTRLGLCSAPLRSRCQHVHRLEYYSDEELSRIVKRSAELINCQMDDEACREVASRSRGTPRIANNLLHWVRDYAQVKADGFVTLDLANKALNMLNIDSNGLDEMDKKILNTIAYNFDCGPVGIKNIAVSVGEEVGTLEDVYEPYLIQEGYLVRTQTGRVISQKTKNMLGLSKDSDDQQGLPNL